MNDLRGRISGNTIILADPPKLPEGSEVMVHIEEVRAPVKEPERTPGILKGKIWMAEDFDEIPPGFEEYMP